MVVNVAELPIPESQTALLLHGPKQPYEVVRDLPIPKLKDDHEVLVKTLVIGLNPLDWKAPDFNFAIPELPYISGREFSGEVVLMKDGNPRFQRGDKVIVISTDYRDLRKAAYQQYAVAYDFNVARLPRNISLEDGATVGVAFVAATLALGISMGVDFTPVLSGPDLHQLVRSMRLEEIPEDVREECLEGIKEHERAKAGDWVVIWGGSSTTANLTIQLARLAQLKVIVVVDKAKHGLRLSSHPVLRPDLLVDSHDRDRAVEIIRSNTRGDIRFALDTRGRDTAAILLRCLTPGGTSIISKGQVISQTLSPPATPTNATLLRAHLVGLTGLPKGSPPEGTFFHTVPIKLFHEVPSLGNALVSWLERLLESGQLSTPEIIDVEEGLANVNQGLDRMRRGEISGGKLVVRV